MIRALLVGGCLGSVTGVIGASISDPEAGFPAWVDLTGVVAGFGLGLLVTGLVLLGRATWSRRRSSIEMHSTVKNAAVTDGKEETVSGANKPRGLERRERRDSAPR